MIGYTVGALAVILIAIGVFIPYLHFLNHRLNGWATLAFYVILGSIIGGQAARMVNEAPSRPDTTVTVECPRTGR